MVFTLEPITGSDLTVDRDNMSIVRKYRIKQKLPYSPTGDCFDEVASLVMAAVKNDYPAYSTPIGMLYWSSIQLHESFYAQHYEIGVTYTPYGGDGSTQSGTYMVRVEHAAGMAKATAGTRIAGYPTGTAVDNGGVIWNGQEVVGIDVPHSQSRIVVSYRHPEMYLNHAYLRAVGALTGHPNNDVFLGYEPGEIAYAGGNASESEAEASAEYSFEVSRNELHLSVGGIMVSEKKGFDVVSPVYKWDTAVDGSGNTKAVRPIDYIEIIRPRGREWMDYVSVFGWG